MKRGWGGETLGGVFYECHYSCLDIFAAVFSRRYNISIFTTPDENNLGFQFSFLSPHILYQLFLRGGGQVLGRQVFHASQSMC